MNPIPPDLAAVADSLLAHARQQMDRPVTYDAHGRMQYHPDYHAKQKTPWTTTDEKYLVENYAALGPEQVSLALERTIHTVMTRAYELRKAGRMPKAAKRTWTKRMRTDEAP